ncbi:MAG: sodium/proline symporter [Butyribacter sp.]|nr:sodium/proline symporter [bacterium]MDY3854839.1 sodium/proline symporter [Butyribacter sp.]
MNTRTLGILAVIIFYLIMMVTIGIIYSKKNNDVNDFYLGGRKLGPLVTAMSAEASDMSSWLLMGLPGVAYLSGVADAGWTAIGLGIGTYLNWLFVAKRLRRYSHKANNSITIPEFFSNRYRDTSHIISAIAAIIIVIFFVPYTASGFAACGKLFGTLFNAPYLPMMILSAVIIVAYTALGGFLAASTTDLIQSIVMTIALIIVVIFGVSLAGGPDVVLENAKSLSGYLSMTKMHDVTTGQSSPYGFLTIISTLAWGLGYFGMPHILLRFMGIEDENKLKLSRRIATVWVTISMFVAIGIGIIGYSVSQAGHIDVFTDSSQSETLIIKIAILLSKHGVLAVILAGLIMAGILACTMSTSDSQLLAASSSVSQNLLHDVFKINLSQKASMVVARLTVVVIALVGVFIARDPNSSVFNIVSFAWAGFGASFGPVMLFSLFWKRSNKYGALAGMLVGGVMVFVWKYLLRPLGGVWDIYELLPAFILASIAIVVVSLLTPPPSKEIVEEFESV